MSALASFFLYGGVTQMYNSKTPTNINKKKYLYWKSCLHDLYAKYGIPGWDGDDWFLLYGRYVNTEVGLQVAARARIFKHLWNLGIDLKEWIPSAYVAWRAGTLTLLLLDS